MTHHSPNTSVLTVAVTGATGFIGARLIEMLADASAGEHFDKPRVLARRGAATTADSRAVDLRDSEAVGGAIAGCRAVVHCAFDFADMDANITIAGALGQACSANAIRLVHVSTAAVYEPFPDGDLDETGGSDGHGSDYKQVKLAIEGELLRQSREDGLDLVILQPTIVYGPGGRAWTDSPTRELLTGTVVLPDAGRGLCNAVHVDDVCRAILAALTARIPSGERVLVSGAPVAWRDFYGAYQAMLGVEALELLPEAARPEPATGRVPASAASSRRADLKRITTRLLGARALSRLSFAVNFARGLATHRRHVPTGPKLALFHARCHVRIDKARLLLGYEPQLDLQQGMRMTEPYVRAAYGRLARLRRRRR